MNQNPNSTIGLNQTKGVDCANCGGIFFEQPVLVRKISRFLTGTAADQIMFVPVMRCQDCGEVLKEFFPEGMADVEEKLGLTQTTVEEQPKSKLFNIN